MTPACWPCGRMKVLSSVRLALFLGGTRYPYCEALALSSRFISSHVSFPSVSLNNATCPLKPGNTQKRTTRVGVIPGFPDSLFLPLIFNIVLHTILAGQGTQQINDFIYCPPPCPPQGHLRISLLFYSPSLPHLTSQTARP